MIPTWYQSIMCTSPTCTSTTVSIAHTCHHIPSNRQAEPTESTACFYVQSKLLEVQSNAVHPH